MARSRRWIFRFALTFALSVAAAVAVAAPAVAANSVYWGNFSANTITFANLDGSGGGNVNTTGAAPGSPSGVGFDAAGGKVYWANANGNSIAFTNLDNSGGTGTLNITGATIDTPEELAVDRAGGRVYWANYGNSTISFANLDNSGGGGTLNTTGATVSRPIGIAIDRGSNRIYWANFAGNKISFANLDNSGGGGDLNTTGATVNGPFGVALDPVNGRIYWANQAGSIGFANANDTGGGGDLNTTGAAVTAPSGVAVDPARNKVYWANENAAISFANADGSGGGGNLNVAGATLGIPDGPALLQAPSGAGAPAISGGSVAPSTLSCSSAKWASDLTGSQLYRAPQSFSFGWSLNGKPIPGATKSSIVASSSGSYVCQVTATNHAGSTTQTSAAQMVSSPPSATARLISVSHSGATARLTLGCGGSPGQQCSVNVTGTARARKRVTVLGASFSVPAGNTQLARVTLNKAGKRLLSRSGTVSVQLSFSGSLATTRPVRFSSHQVSATTPPDEWFQIALPCSDCYTTAQNVPIVGLSKGVHVSATCRGAGCPFGRRSITPRHGRVNLAAVLGTSHLEPGTVVQVAITKKGVTGLIIRYAIKKGFGPIRSTLCLAPGARRATRCT